MNDRSITRAWVEERLDTLYPTHVAALVPLLSELRALFDGDLEAMLILATTSIATEADGWHGTLFDAKPLNAVHKPTNAQSIANVTGIPRETVRRKLRWLEEKGWAKRDACGNWYPSDTAARDLKAGSAATVTYLRTILNAAAKAS
ncbi:hypothetical protein P6F26_09430 [Roseibacterium sp. SDUM158017]|uniref:hypothetical protein n=1 Tax=Roseicyclus salinarum TaxID=3036773 RepID=UPI002415236D|nr:hypothetical protein [Roseibacterium sp. SDUM158017]MDG4648668.1 hypothetical protein [Roseibacterium sp. SDUM158017]